MSWLERAADQSEAAQRARDRRIQHATQIVDAGRRLLESDAGSFTIQQLVDEAGVALRTFYRYFAGKDELLLAVLEESIRDAVEQMLVAAETIDDPVDRLESFVTGPLRSLSGSRYGGARAITREHYRLHQVYPHETAAATQPYTDLLTAALLDAQSHGRMLAADVARDAWLVNEIVRATYHHYSFAELGDDAEVVIDGLWSFCRRALEQ